MKGHQGESNGSLSGPRGRRTRHLVFMAHLWACAPFVVAWHLFPQLRQEHRAEVLDALQVLCRVAAVALVARTVLAWLDPPWLAWDYVFPVVDLLMVTLALYLRRDPNSVLMFAYFLPIAEAASTLNVRWASVVGLLSVGAAALVTYGQSVVGPIEAGFRLFILYIVARLLTWMGRLAADLRADLTVAADRNRIALEMHDGVQGQLITIASRLELTRHVAPRDGARAAALASDTRDLARQAADELRFLVQRLRTPELGKGFLPALKQYVHHLGERNDLAVTFGVTGEEYALAPEVEHALFRIVQESLTNTLKHAAARNVTLEVTYEPQAVRCALVDDGTGFTLEAGSASQGEHWGLESMRLRAERVDGVLHLETTPGSGTTVTATVPRGAGKPRRGDTDGQ